MAEGGAVKVQGFEIVDCSGVVGNGLGTVSEWTVGKGPISSRTVILDLPKQQF